MPGALERPQFQILKKELIGRRRVRIFWMPPQVDGGEAIREYSVGISMLDMDEEFREAARTNVTEVSYFRIKKLTSIERSPSKQKSLWQHQKWLTGHNVRFSRQF